MTFKKCVGDAGNNVQTKRANAEGDRSRKKSTHSRAGRRETGPDRQRMSNRLYLSLSRCRAGYDQPPRFFSGRKSQHFIGGMVFRRPHRDQTNWHRQRANPVGDCMHRAKEQQSSDRKSCSRTHLTTHYTAPWDFSWGFFGMSDTFEAESLCHA